MIENGLYKFAIKLLNKLDYSFKRNFIMSLNSESNFMQSSRNILIKLLNLDDMNTKFSLPVYYVIVPMDQPLVKR